jgi:predicted methyltransferase
VITPDISAVVDAADRTAEDKQTDERRHPAELLAFSGVKSGMKVADLAAAAGYTTELLARMVGPTGVVYGQNPKLVLERFAAKPWSERLEKPELKNVVRADRELDDPLPPEAKDLDLVTFVLFYHDTTWLKTDRARMNAAIFVALKPGGRYVVVDASAKPGTGDQDGATLHRIDEQLVKDEVTKAGFQLSAEGDFMRNPADTRDWSSVGDKDKGASDRFVLAFTKPG